MGELSRVQKHDRFGNIFKYFLELWAELFRSSSFDDVKWFFR